MTPNFPSLAALLVCAATTASAQATPATVDLPITDPDDIAALCGGDPNAGLPNFEASCAACHTLAEGEPHLEGPNLYALYGRTAAQAEGFDYSAALTAAGQAGLVWDRDTLRPFFADPQGEVPGVNHPPLPELVDEAYLLNLMTYVRVSTTPPPPSLDEVEVPAHIYEIEGDVAYGEYLSGECAACHVADGTSAGGVPAIHGLDRDYLLLALYQYKTGARDNSTMISVAGSLGDQEMAALAAYFAVGLN